MPDADSAATPAHANAAVLQARPSRPRSFLLPTADRPTARVATRLPPATTRPATASSGRERGAPRHAPAPTFWLLSSEVAARCCTRGLWQAGDWRPSASRYRGESRENYKQRLSAGCSTLMSLLGLQPLADRSPMLHVHAEAGKSTRNAAKLRQKSWAGLNRRTPSRRLADGRICIGSSTRTHARSWSRLAERPRRLATRLTTPL